MLNPFLLLRSILLGSLPIKGGGGGGKGSGTGVCAGSMAMPLLCSPLTASRPSSPSLCPPHLHSDLQTGVGPPSAPLQPYQPSSLNSPKQVLFFAVSNSTFGDSPLNSSQLLPLSSTASLGLQLPLQGLIQRPLSTPPSLTSQLHLPLPIILFSELPSSAGPAISRLCHTFPFH